MRVKRNILTLELLLKLRRVRGEVHTLHHDLQDTGHAAQGGRNLEEQCHKKIRVSFSILELLV